MTGRGLLPTFSPAVLAELEGVPNAPSDATLKDLRALPWVSIDNDDSRDLDQLSVGSRANGVTTLRVAIADVDAVVRKGSAIDDHARTNTTSVYTAAQVFPMLPERLSYDLTSLVEGQERLAVVVELFIGADGHLTGSSVFRARVQNHAKLAYDSVAAWLDGAAPPPGVLGTAQTFRSSCACRTKWRLRSQGSDTNMARSTSRPSKPERCSKARRSRGCARSRRTAPRASSKK